MTAPDLRDSARSIGAIARAVDWESLTASTDPVVQAAIGEAARVADGGGR